MWNALLVSFRLGPSRVGVLTSLGADQMIGGADYLTSEMSVHARLGFRPRVPWVAGGTPTRRDLLFVQRTMCACSVSPSRPGSSMPTFAGLPQIGRLLIDSSRLCVEASNAFRLSRFIEHRARSRPRCYLSNRAQFAYRYPVSFPDICLAAHSQRRLLRLRSSTSTRHVALVAVPYRSPALPQMTRWQRPTQNGHARCPSSRDRWVRNGPQRS